MRRALIVAWGVGCFLLGPVFVQPIVAPADPVITRAATAAPNEAPPVLPEHCSAGRGPAGEVPSLVIISKDGRQHVTRRVGPAIRVALGEIDAPNGLVVVAFCYDSLKD